MLMTVWVVMCYVGCFGFGCNVNHSDATNKKDSLENLEMAKISF